MRTLVPILWLASGAALAAPLSPLPSRLAVEGGWRHPGLSNGVAWSEGFAARATVEWGQASSYAVQLGYGLGAHTLVRPNALFVSPPTLQDWEGTLRMHQVQVGVRVQPEAALGSTRHLRPWLATSVGAAFTDVQLRSASRPDLEVDRVHLQPNLELGLGLDFLLRSLSLAPVARVTAIPWLARDTGAEEVDLRLFATVGAGLQLAWDPQ